MTAAEPTYSFLGPAGTFTELALKQVPEAQGKPWRAVNNVGEAIADVASGRSTAAMIAMENSIEGGVSATQDALATVPDIRIVGEYLVPVNFVLVARPGTTLADVHTVSAHPVAYAQTRGWLERTLPAHGHLPAASNVQAAEALFAVEARAEAAVAPPSIVERLRIDVLGDRIGDNPKAVTRFVLVTRDHTLPAPTGADKTSVIVELPEEQPGALLEMLEQFSTRGVNLSLLESRPIGDALGRYRFVIDIDGHAQDERVADALLGLRRYSPNIRFLGSYPRADRSPISFDQRYADEVFIEARDWLRGILTGEPAND